MAEEWDLSAIVRSCQSATTSTATTTEIPPTTTTTTQNNTSSSFSLASCSTSGIVREEHDMFSFPNNNLLQPIANEFEEIEQLMMTPFNPTTSTSGVGIDPNSPDFEGCITDPSIIIWPPTHLVPPSTSTFHHQQQQQLPHKQEYPQVSQTSSTIVLPDTLQQPQTPRSRKRKSQQKRMVCQVSAENLSADMWAWRKYGQKPIKGSPYPRNYYRCSSSKGCSARKQVERSNEEGNMFIITYTGDHNHPKPTHRNSLAGSTRSKPSSQNQSTAAAVAVAPPPPPPPLEQENDEEMMEIGSPDPETETEGDCTDWTGFSPG